MPVNQESIYSSQNPNQIKGCLSLSPGGPKELEGPGFSLSIRRRTDQITNAMSNTSNEEFFRADPPLSESL